VLPSVKYPYAKLLRKRPGTTHRPKSDLLPGTFHFEGITGLQMQLFPQWLRYDDAASFIDDKAFIHSGTIPWDDPSVNTIV